MTKTSVSLYSRIVHQSENLHSRTPMAWLPALAVATAVAMSAWAAPAVADNAGRSVPVVQAADAAAAGGGQVRRIHAPLPHDPVGLALTKAAGRETWQLGGRIAGQGTGSSPRAAAAAPTLVKGFSGPTDARYAPSDSTSAVGRTRYIQMVNSRVAISDKNGGGTGSGTLSDYFGWPSETDVFDPQVIWDASTNRFYMVAAVTVHPHQNYLVYAYSKTDTPSGSSSFCQYAIGPIYYFPDYPKLGDTKTAVLVGVNTFESTSGGFVEADLYAIAKPPAGTTCSDPDSMVVKGFGPLRTYSGGLAFTPIPANQIDTSNIGWIVGSPAASGASQLVLWKVKSDAAGNVTVENQDLKGARVDLPRAYTIPQNAPQPGTDSELDTLDGRLTQAISAINPARGNTVSLWTQHTVSHALTAIQPIVNGAEVRWYEISVATASLRTWGKLASQTRFYFNGAISPDRAVDGTKKKFGNTMVLQASATATGILPTSRMSPLLDYVPQLYPSIVAVAKTTGKPQTAPLTVFEGHLILDDFSCGIDYPTCRWGDYSAMTPDPTPPDSAARGRVWGINQLGDGPKGLDPYQGTWSTYNFIIDP